LGNREYLEDPTAHLEGLENLSELERFVLSIPSSLKNMMGSLAFFEMSTSICLITKQTESNLKIWRKVRFWFIFNSLNI
jgi:hypothetical protein